MKRTDMLLFTVAAAITLLSRLPFLDAGYGWDNDAWGNMEAARLTATTGIPHLSRPPGYPILVGLFACAWRGGPLAANGITALFSALAAGAFALILRQQGARFSLALAGSAALAMTPVVYIHSTVAMDYMWALAFLLGAWWMTAADKPAPAGLCLGAAVGCRITSALFCAPLFILIPAPFFSGAWWRRSLVLGVAFACAALAGYAPVLLAEGIAYLRLSPQPWIEFLPHLAQNATVGVWGIVGCLALGGALIAWGLGASRPLSPAPDARRTRSASAVAVLAYAALFLRLPAESAYLIPAVPFVLLLLWHMLKPSAFALLCVALIASPWLCDVARPPPYARAYDSDDPPARVPRGLPHVNRRGPVLREQHNRRRQMTGIWRALDSIPVEHGLPILVSAGSYTVYLSEMVPHDPAPSPSLAMVKELSPPEIAAALRQGRDVLLFRGYDNTIVLGYRATRGPSGDLQAAPLFLYDLDERGALHEASWSLPDLALLATTLNPDAQSRVWDVVLFSEWWVPSSRTLHHQGQRIVPVFDRPSRVSQDLVRRAGPFALRRGLDIVLAAPDETAVDINPGQVMGWTISARQVAELKRSLSPR